MRRVLAALAVALFASAAQAQAPPVTSYQAPWSPVGALVTLAVTNASGNVQMGWATQSPLPNPTPPSAIITNTGANAAYCTAGGSSVAATTTGSASQPVTFVPSGGSKALALNGNQYIACITASSTTNVTIEAGSGSASNDATPGGGSAGGMTVTANNSVNPTAINNLLAGGATGPDNSTWLSSGLTIKGAFNITSTGSFGGSITFGSSAGAVLTGVAGGTVLTANSVGYTKFVLNAGGTFQFETGGATGIADFGITNSGAWTFLDHLYLTGLTAGSGTSALCLNSSGNQVETDTNTTICGFSAAYTKNINGYISFDDADRGLIQLSTDRKGIPFWQFKDKRYGDTKPVHVGLIADDVEKMDPRCAIYDKSGKLKNYEDRCVLAYVVADLAKLRAEIAKRDLK